MILARACGLEVGQRGGIVIDNECKTSDPDIYAIGECALWNGMIYGLVAPGYAMARTVVADLAGNIDSSFTGADMSTKLKLMGVDVASIGDAHAIAKVRWYIPTKMVRMKFINALWSAQMVNNYWAQCWLVKPQVTVRCCNIV